MEDVISVRKGSESDKYSHKALEFASVKAWFNALDIMLYSTVGEREHLPMPINRHFIIVIENNALVRLPSFNHFASKLNVQEGEHVA